MKILDFTNNVRNISVEFKIIMYSRTKWSKYVYKYRNDYNLWTFVTRVIREQVVRYNVLSLFLFRAMLVTFHRYLNIFVALLRVELSAILFKLSA